MERPIKYQRAHGRVFRNYPEGTELPNMIFLEKDDPVISVDEWMEKGQPQVWRLQFNGSATKVYADEGQGGIMIELVGEVMPEPNSEEDKLGIRLGLCFQGIDMVETDDGEYVAFGDYYEGILRTYEPYEPSANRR